VDAQLTVGGQHDGTQAIRIRRGAGKETDPKRGITVVLTQQLSFKRGKNVRQRTRGIVLQVSQSSEEHRAQDADERGAREWLGGTRKYLLSPDRGGGGDSWHTDLDRSRKNSAKLWGRERTLKT